MQRRSLLRFGAAGSAALALGGLALPQPALASRTWLEAYHAARERQDWLLGVHAIGEEQLRAPLETITGRLPAGLAGTFYRNGPALHHLGGRRYHHWFDADGMIQSFRMNDGAAEHYGRYVQTHKHRREREAGVLRYPGFATRFDDAWPINGPDDINAANTSAILFDDRLLALWEGGSAYALDPTTLDTFGPVTWAEGLEGVPFSAHPKVEPDGTLWNFGISAVTEQMLIYEVAANGRLRRIHVSPLPSPALIHDFVVTEHYLVFLMPPLRFNRERLAAGNSFLYSHEWRGDEPMAVLVVDKADFARQYRLELPAGFVFHLAGGWDESNGIVHLAYERHSDASVVLEFASDLMRGRVDGARLRAETHRVTLDLNEGSARQTRVDGDSEFPRIHPQHTGRRYRYHYSVSATDPDHPFGNALRRLDLDTGAEQRYDFGPQVIAEEHLPIPAGAREADVWVVGTCLDLAARHTRLNVFDGRRLADGPVFAAALPYALPLGFHGSFAPRQTG